MAKRRGEKSLAERDVVDSPPLEAGAVKQLKMQRVRPVGVSNYSPQVEVIEEDEASGCEMPTSSRMAENESPTSSEITPLTANVDSEIDGSEGHGKLNETERPIETDMANMERMATPRETPIPQKTTNPSTTPQPTTSCQTRVSRKKRATQRYDIEVNQKISTGIN